MKFAISNAIKLAHILAITTIIPSDSKIACDLQIFLLTINSRYTIVFASEESETVSYIIITNKSCFVCVHVTAA